MADLTKTEALERVEALEQSADRYRRKLKSLEEAQEVGNRALMRGGADSIAKAAGVAFAGWVTADRKIWKTKIPVSTVPAAVALLLDLVGWSEEFISVGALSELLQQPIVFDFGLYNYKKRLAWQMSKSLNDAANP